jgi:ATP-binding cassette subfamily B protein
MGAGFMVTMIQRGAASLGRVNEVLMTLPTIRSPEQARNMQGEGTAPAIEIRNLTFTYPAPGNLPPGDPPAPPPALRDVSLSIPGGNWVGILGRTGAGKSTLIKSLTRTIDPPPGTVMVFGADVRDWDLKRLRGFFAVAPQDSCLFSDSIKNNMSYGLEQSAEALLKEAADTAALGRDLAAFPEGWDTLIGERGLTLSGGQKQRVAISRAVILKRDILILDDSLSAVDAETESHILSRLLSQRKGKTTIIISHRVSSLRHADIVVVLEKGAVCEYGSPRELASRGGFYARTAALQRLDPRHG